MKDPFYLTVEVSNYFAPNVFNPWRHEDDLDISADPVEERRRRLYAHFNCDPEYVLIGEAPGYQGCHFTGVPFTSERLVCEGIIPRVKPPQWGRITRRMLPWSEPSATIVWKCLRSLGITEKTVMWNAFAWHPHQHGVPLSNRTPTRKEILDGAPILKLVLDHFNTARFIAVGHHAQIALRDAGITAFATARHPAMGGARRFVADMQRLGAVGSALYT